MATLLESETIKREQDFKRELQLLCDKHSVTLKSGYNIYTDTAIYAQFNDLSDDAFVIDEHS